MSRSNFQRELLERELLARPVAGLQYMLGQLSPAMQIPMWIVYSAPCVGFALTAIRELQTIIYRIKHLGDPYEDPAEPDLENL